MFYFKLLSYEYQKLTSDSIGPCFRSEEQLPEFAKKFGYDYAFMALIMSSAQSPTGFEIEEHGYRHVVKDRKWGLCDAKGQELLPCIYESIDYIYLTMAFLIVLYKKDGKCGGHWFYPDIKPLPLIYDSLYWDRFHFPDMIAFEKDGKEGIMDFNQIVKVPLYKHLRPLCHRKFPDLIAENDLGKFGIIDLNNNIKVPFEYDIIYKENHKVVGKIGLNKYILMDSPENNWRIF